MSVHGLVLTAYLLLVNSGGIDHRLQVTAESAGQLTRHGLRVIQRVFLGLAQRLKNSVMLVFLVHAAG